MTAPVVGPVDVQKNRAEVLRLAVDEFKGRMLLSFRVWFEPREGGDLRPGREGFALAVEKLPEVIAGLQRLEAEARTAGLIA